MYPVRAWSAFARKGILFAVNLVPYTRQALKHNAYIWPANKIVASEILKFSEYTRLVEFFALVRKLCAKLQAILVTVGYATLFSFQRVPIIIIIIIVVVVVVVVVVISL